MIFEETLKHIIMKRTLKIITIVSISLASLYSFAQEKFEHGKHRHHNPKVLLEKLDAKLNLNETQEKRVFTLLENRLNQHQALRKEMKLERKEYRKEMEMVMKSVLTEEQLAKFQKLKAERKAEMHKKYSEKTECKDAKGKRHERIHPQERLERLSKELDLSLRQQETLKNIFKEKRNEFHKDHPEYREARKKLKRDFMKDMKAILTPEQFKTFKELKEQHHKRKQKVLHD